jgi:hypothetical protein
MSNPAIVLMTDPSQCSLGDVHHLVQALAEIQQMGEHAIPQAFCDHPEAAGDFIDAYALAYPQLVLEDREIPTPDHLHSLISTGQVGGLGRPPEPATSDDLQPPAEPNGANVFPIVMLTLGSSQALLDALQQSPTMRESIRLIDIGQEKDDALSVSIADAVVIRGLDGEPWQHARAGMDRLELDDISGAAKADLTSLALHDDQMSLDVVETAEVSSRESSAYDHGGAHVPGPVVPPAAAVKPAPAAVDVRAGSASPDNSLGSTTATEPASETASQPASQPVASRSSDSDLVEPGDSEPVEPEAQAPDEPADEGEGQVGQSPEGRGPDKEAGKDLDNGAGKGAGKDVDKDVDAVKKAGQVARDQDDDVHYPPVGSLIAGADVLYPALDQDGAHGALRELASVLLDDGIFDPEQASDFIEAQRGEGLPAPARQEANFAVRSGDKLVTIEDVYGAGDQESEDQLADSHVARPLHDSDL